MTQEDKKLLLTHLSALLQHKVKVATPKGINILTSIEVCLNDIIICSCPYGHFLIEDVKPYLRPMSSMTEEEKVQLSQYACIGEDLNGEFIDEVQRKDCAAYIDWLNKNHFDYRGLIEKGLALEASEGMYNIKER